MWWTWYNVLLFVWAVLFIALAIWTIGEDGIAPFFFVLAVMCAGLPFVITHDHTAKTHDREAKAKLQAQGFDVVEADTRGDEATVQFGACTREFRMERHEGQLRLLAQQANGEWRIFPRSLAGQAGKACNVTIG